VREAQARGILYAFAKAVMSWLDQVVGRELLLRCDQ
jgi:hypothetical protein